jgi:hypothetical protein
MVRFKLWLAKSPYGTAFKTFLGLLLSAVIATWTGEGKITFDHWQTWVIFALAPIVPVVINLLNDKDDRMGIGKTP